MKPFLRMFSLLSLLATAGLSAEPAPHYFIESNFVEVDRETMKEIPGLMFPATGESQEDQASSLVSLEQYKRILEKIAGQNPQSPRIGRRSVPSVPFPSVTTLAGQRCVVQITREFRFPTKLKAAENGHWGVLPTEFELENLGIVLSVEPLPGGLPETIELVLALQIVEISGYARYHDGIYVPLEEPLSIFNYKEMGERLPSEANWMPAFNRLEYMTSLVLRHDEVAMLGPLQPATARRPEISGRSDNSSRDTKAILAFLRVEQFQPTHPNEGEPYTRKLRGSLERIQPRE